MSESETVDIDGVEFNVKSIEEAIDIAADEDGNIQGGAVLHDNIIIVGDFEDDDFFYAAHVEDVETVHDYSLDADPHAYTYVKDVKEDIERQSSMNAVKYVEDLVHPSNQVEHAFDNRVYIVHGSFNGNELEALSNDEHIEFVKVDHDGSRVEIDVRVDEDAL